MPDAYTRKARVAPALLVATPGAAMLIAGALSPETVLRVAGVFLGALGIVVAILVRDAGRRVQPALWRGWGGPPAQMRLRWDSGTPEAAVARLHRRVESVTGEPLPGPDAEAADRIEADRQYDDAIAVLRERTRDAAAFPLVAAENTDYGFRRNCLGLRPFARVTSLLGLAASVAFLALGSGGFDSRARWGPAAAVCALCALFWLFVVNSDWVRSAADNYADRLLGAVDVLAASDGQS